jgi:hypothetical protein
MSEREAQELIAKADKKSTSSSWFFGANAKYEESADLYTKAANIFKMAKRCRSKPTSLLHNRTTTLWTDSRRLQRNQNGDTLGPIPKDNPYGII